MTNLRVDTIRSRDGNNGPIFEGDITFSSTSHIVLPKGTTAQRPVGVSTGSMRYNTSTSNVEYYNGTTWLEVSSYDPTVRGLFGGASTPLNVIDYITIGSLGNATDFGDLTVSRGALSACSSSTRGVFGGGTTPVSAINTIDYITIATTGNAIDFGDLTIERRFLASCSSSTRGIFGGGYTASPTFTNTNTIDYITIATTGNAIDFGDLTVARLQLASCSSSTRGVFGGGNSPIPTPVGTYYSTIDYVTIATTGNATNFGSLTQQRTGLAACSNSTRGVFGGGYAKTSPFPGFLTQDNYNIIDYITIASTGTATDFGDLLTTRYNLAACSSSTRGLFGGGLGQPSAINSIYYVTIATTANVSYFGDLTVARQQLAACSNGHGGL